MKGLRLMKKKELVYISHPYGGNINNYEQIEEVIREYVEEDNEALPISPVLIWASLYEVVDYEEGLSMCLDLLSRCNRIYMCGDWKSSRGCMAEWAFAKAKGIPIDYERE